MPENQRAKVGNPKWKPGVSGNPAGRPRSSLDSYKVRKVRQEALVAMAEHVAETPTQLRTSVQILQEFANDKAIPTSLRISAAAAAAPYETPRLMSVPPPIYLYSQVEIPEFIDIAEAEAFLLILSKREAAGELETASAAIIYERVRGWIQQKRADQEIELKRLNAGQETGEQIIRISGGLPQLPGTNVTMPHELASNGHVLEGNTAQGLLNPQPGPKVIQHVEASSPQIESAPETTAHDEQS